MKKMSIIFLLKSLKRCGKKVVCYCFYKIFSKKNNKTRQNIFLFKIILLPLQTLS